MTTNQTIDGVPRDLLESLQRSSRGMGWIAKAEELRALLDAPTQKVFACWSCKDTVSMRESADADGDCPHCGVELDIED